MNPLFDIDFYKVGHVSQYPSDTTQVWSNWTARSTRMKGVNEVVFFGLQYFIKENLIKQWELEFFSQPVDLVVNNYKKLITATLGVVEPKVDHIVALHKLGYLPLEIYALPEGTLTPIGVPMFVITNTHPCAYWLPNYLESVLSASIWKACTSATIAREYRKLFTKYAVESGETDLSFIDWQGHDFSFRGMSGKEDAILSGMGHLLSFSGTDTVPAIVAAAKYYSAELNVGGSVPATEHSVMSAYGKEDEFETFRHIIQDVYPTGIVSIVSDTWDLWTVLTDYVPRLKNQILARDGKLVIRPDSGDPVKIICGEVDYRENKAFHLESSKYSTGIHPKYHGVLGLLATYLGVDANKPGLPLINKGGAIYGDSITLERADQILERTVNELKLSPFNVVFGIGSFTYEYQTRDTFGFAMKATAVRRGDTIHEIFKDPVTDDGGKKSLKGIPAVYEHEDDNHLYVVQGATPEQLENCAFQKVFSNGKLLINQKFDDIRKLVRQ